MIYGRAMTKPKHPLLCEGIDLCPPTNGDIE